MKIRKATLRKIIREEKARLLREQTPADQGMMAARGDAMQSPHGIFDSDYISDLLAAEIQDYLAKVGKDALTVDEYKAFERALQGASGTNMDFVEG